MNSFLGYRKPVKPRVEKNLCCGCGQCIRFCAFNAITLVEGKAVIDEEKCRNCRKCINFCNQLAII
ncbi:4Fe-4S dicluster domain-containing protein [Thermobrachium celere]|uniref:Ferredoxin 2 n=1 Tax=Thermobrachium celere DSM 8682 TaxID=941824 RepID=R7RT45_9CLOT|nr:4Fe-4S dicluster domain-containing protein [Thermobrachium celere]GFR34582.1 hypothetical protein TCEA9_03940 [Thermobrachium celere]CDF58425.1 Ferredoxin 2 [Thermobrachium celere DSM 8682]